MQDRINKVVPGTGIRASWGNEVIDQLKRLHIIPGNGIKVSTSSKGTVIALKDEGSTGSNNGSGMSDVVPCIINQTTDNDDPINGYNVDLYANGFQQESTGTGILYLPEVTTHTKLPSNTAILAHICPATFTQSDEDGDEVGG